MLILIAYDTKKYTHALVVNFIIQIFSMSCVNYRYMTLDTYNFMQAIIIPHSHN